MSPSFKITITYIKNIYKYKLAPKEDINIINYLYKYI